LVRLADYSLTLESVVIDNCEPLKEAGRQQDQAQPSH